MSTKNFEITLLEEYNWKHQNPQDSHQITYFETFLSIKTKVMSGGRSRNTITTPLHDWRIDTRYELRLKMGNLVGVM